MAATSASFPRHTATIYSAQMRDPATTHDSATADAERDGEAQRTGFEHARPSASNSGLTPQQWWEVATAPPELAARCGALLPDLGVVPIDELERFAVAVAADRSLWEPLVVVDATRRRYRLLFEDDRVDVWVLSWMAGQGTGFHDHDLSCVGLACAAGEVVERQMLLPTGASSVSMTPGVSRQGPAGYIHSVTHAAGAPAVTIHAYSPPLERVGQYRVDGTGILRRTVEHGRQELLDHSIAKIDPERA